MKISPRQFVKLRHEEFRSRALPVLKSIGFEKCPMGKPYWGSEPHGGFQYDLCRLRAGSILELMTVYIIQRRNRRFQVEYNQIEIFPSVDDLSKLRGVDDMPFRIPPASATQMEIPPPRWLGEPFWPPPYKVALWRLWFGVGVQRSISSAITRMIRDLKNFERFVRHWEKTRMRIRIDLKGKLMSSQQEKLRPKGSD
jgi:hypothetical protein